MLLVLVAGIGIAALVWGRDETVIPQWTVKVQTSAGAPVPGVPVVQEWLHQTMENRPHVDRRTTDDKGVVVFPKRHIRGSALRRILGTVTAVLHSSFHASFGPFGYVIVGIDGKTTGCDLDYMPREPREEPLMSTCVITGPFTVRQP